MSLKNLALDVKSIALALSEEGGYEYYDIDDDLKELAKNVSDMQAENDKLRELLVGAFEDMNAWQMVIAGSNEWGYGKGCLDRLCKLRDAMQELGIEVDE